MTLPLPPRDPNEPTVGDMVRLLRDTPTVVPPTNDRVLGFNFISTPGMRDDLIVALDPGSQDHSGVYWHRNEFRITPEVAEARRVEAEENIRRLGERINYPASQMVRMGTITGRTSSRDPAESNPPRRSVEEICADIANPEIPLPNILPEVVFRDYDGLLPRSDRVAMNSAVQSQNSDAVMQRLHEEFRALGASIRPLTLATQRMGRALRDAGDRPPPVVEDLLAEAGYVHTPAGDARPRTVGFAQRILRRAAETRVVSDFPEIVDVQGVVNNEGQAIGRDEFLAGMERLLRSSPPADAERRRQERVLSFASRYGMGSSRLASLDFASLEQNALLYLDTEASFGTDWSAIFGQSKKKKWEKPPKGSLRAVPGKAPMGRTYAAIMIESAIHIIGTVPAMGTLIGDLDRPVRFSQESRPVYKRSEVQHSIPHSQSVTGHVVLLNDFLAKVRGKRITSLHDEWEGKVRAVMFGNETIAKSVRGFKKV